MAIEAQHMSLFPSQFLPNREMVDQPNATRYDDLLQTAYGIMDPIPETKMEKMIPMYGSRMRDSFPTPAFKADSGLTSSLHLSRKRQRQSSSFDPPFSVPNTPIVYQNQFNDHHHLHTFSFLNEDIASHSYQKQLEIDRFISQHSEMVRREIEEMRRRNSRRLIAAVEEGIMKRLKAKEEEIVKIGQLNWSLEEKVKSLNVENQIWKQLAQTNEATANTLRNNLQQVLAQVQIQQQYGLDFTDNAEKPTASIDDVQSHCGSNHDDEGEGERKSNHNNVADENRTSSNSSRYGRINRWCRNCGKKESCVLLLPCRHLCVCTVCASSISICPVCNSTKSAGVYVNMN